VDIKKYLLFGLFFITSTPLLTQQGPSPEDVMDNLMKNFSPEEQEAIMSEAKRIEDHLGSLSPEDRAHEEQMLMEEADKMWQDMMQELPPEPKPEPVKAPAPQPVKQEPAKPKVVTPKKDLSKIENALDALVESLSSITLKAQSLPRVSTKASIEAGWPDTEAGFAYARSLFKTARNLPKVLSKLTEKENLMFSKNITALSEILKVKEGELVVPNTAKLKKKWKKDKEVDACCTEDIKKAQDKLEDIINYTNLTFDSGLITQLRSIINKIAPEDLKRQEKISGSMPAKFNGSPTPSNKYGGSNHRGAPSYHSGGQPFYGYDEPYYAPGSHPGPAGAKGAQAKPGAKKQQPENPGENKSKSSKGKSLNEPESAALMFSKSLKDIDKKLDKVDLEGKITELAKANEADTANLERDLLPPLSEVHRDLTTAKKHAKKALEKSDKSKEVLGEVYKKSKLHGLKKLDKAIDIIKKKKTISESAATEISSFHKHASKLDAMLLDKDESKEKEEDPAK
jgi:hypothetical protein